MSMIPTADEILEGLRRENESLKRELEYLRIAAPREPSGGLRVTTILRELAEEFDKGYHHDVVSRLINELADFATPKPPESEESEIKNVFTAGYVAGGTAARIYESGEEWRAWLKNEIARLYPTRPAEGKE